MTKLGHVHIKVNNLEAAEAFYTRFIGLKVTERVGQHYVFLSSGNLHHELALQQVPPHAPMPERYAVGLFHTAFEVEDKYAFARAYDALKHAGVPVAITDHRISWAMYFTDPSGNGVEIYLDTRYDPDGSTVWKGHDRTLHEAELRSVLNVVHVSS